MHSVAWQFFWWWHTYFCNWMCRMEWSSCLCLAGEGRGGAERRRTTQAQTYGELELENFATTSWWSRIGTGLSWCCVPEASAENLVAVCAGLREGNRRGANLHLCPRRRQYSVIWRPATAWNVLGVKGTSQGLAGISMSKSKQHICICLTLAWTKAWNQLKMCQRWPSAARTVRCQHPLAPSQPRCTYRDTYYKQLYFNF